MFSFKKIIVSSFFITLLCLGCVFCEDSSEDWGSVKKEITNVTDFAKKTILPAGAALGVVYGAIISYMRSTPWPLVSVGAISVGMKIIFSLVETIG